MNEANENDNNCDFCKKKFASKYNLNLHQKTAKFCLKIQADYFKEQKEKFVKHLNEEKEREREKEEEKEEKEKEKEEREKEEKEEKEREKEEREESYDEDDEEDEDDKDEDGFSNNVSILKNQVKYLLMLLNDERKKTRQMEQVISSLVNDIVTNALNDSNQLIRMSQNRAENNQGEEDDEDDEEYDEDEDEN